MKRESKIQSKPKILCLHGYRTSGAILKKQIEKWPNSVLHQFDFHFIDAPFPSQGKSEVEGIYNPPYFEWFQHNKDMTGYENFESCLEFIENYMVKHGPFDGLLGFSQGGMLAAAFPGLQAKGVALTKVPKIKFVIIISGSKLGLPSLVAQKAYAPSISCPSLHFLSEKDFLMPSGLKLLESFVEPLVISHPKGHAVPRLDEKSLKIVEGFIQRISKL
ncbi:unnamed protein product [Citrullus colocynthis]|uniref:Serine hydrolase domain-containing protein n=1 Tax=Citrullus colocynthis TaxID=252529 RepID=A0ABP0XY14_9ROSI